MEFFFSSLPTFSLLLLLLLSALEVARGVSIGINYGQIADNLPSPEHAVALVKSIGASKVKLYDADPKVLCAFAKTGIEFTVGLGNEYLSQMSDDPGRAREWVKSKVQAFLPDTKITCISVGNEVLTSNDTSLMQHLLPVMHNLQDALVELGIAGQVAVTTAHSLAVLDTSYPPSTGRFRKDVVGSMTEVMNFHCKTGSAILINAYPFFAYKANPNQVSLDFVLFQSNQGILDPSTNLHYDNMLFAQIDALHSALAAIGFNNMTIHVSETGWPSKGDPDETGATLENAKKYNGNLIKVISQKGTPMRPNTDLKVYVFALFNENLKPGPLSERNYGLFNPDGSAVYSLGIAHKDSSGKPNPPPTGSAGNNPPTGSGGNNNNGGVYGLPSYLPDSPNGYIVTSGSVSVAAPAVLLLALINLVVFVR